MTLGLAALLCLLVGVLVPWLLPGRVGGLVAWSLALVGAGLAVVVGARAVSGTSWSSHGALVAPLLYGEEPGLQLHLDRLGGLFLLLVGAVGVPAVLVTADWWRSTYHRPALPSAANLLLAACFLIIAAADVWSLIVGWELLTVAFYAMTMLQRKRPERVSSALAAIGFGKVSGACLTAGLLLLAASSHSTALSDLGGADYTPRVIGYVLLLVAFAVKVGLVPWHVWMPRSYSAAPGPARALMAGVAVNVGFYGCWRTLDILGAPPGWLAVVVMLLGGISALIGIAHASVQIRLTRVVAYSSVENAGLIFAAYGVSLVGAATSSPSLMTVGLVAGTLQVVAHALGKTLLFAAAGVVESAAGSDTLDDLRGVARVLPWSGTGLAVGAVTMAGLPPAVLFVSEWFVLESLLQQFRLDHRLGYTLPMALTGALVALTAGFAGIAFIRLVAFTVLGRTSPALQKSKIRDIGFLGRSGMVLLCVACVAVAGLAPFEIRLLANGLAPVVPHHLVDQVVTDHWVLGPVYRDFSVLSPSWLSLELPLMALAALVVSFGLSRRRMWQVRQVEPWRSATGGVTGADEYTAFGYANPTRRVLANVLRPSSQVHELEADERVKTGSDYRYRADVVEMTEAYVYRPMIGLARRIVSLALRLQNGRLDAYLLYMLIALVAVLAVVSAVG